MWSGQGLVLPHVCTPQVQHEAGLAVTLEMVRTVGSCKRRQPCLGQCFLHLPGQSQWLSLLSPRPPGLPSNHCQPCSVMFRGSYGLPAGPWHFPSRPSMLLSLPEGPWATSPNLGGVRKSSVPLWTRLGPAPAQPGCPLPGGSFQGRVGAHWR